MGTARGHRSSDHDGAPGDQEDCPRLPCNEPHSLLATWHAWGYPSTPLAAHHLDQLLTTSTLCAVLEKFKKLLSLCIQKFRIHDSTGNPYIQSRPNQASSSDEKLSNTADADTIKVSQMCL